MPFTRKEALLATSMALIWAKADAQAPPPPPPPICQGVVIPPQAVMAASIIGVVVVGALTAYTAKLKEDSIPLSKFELGIDASLLLFAAVGVIMYYTGSADTTAVSTVGAIAISLGLALTGFKVGQLNAKGKKSSNPAAAPLLGVPNGHHVQGGYQAVPIPAAVPAATPYAPPTQPVGAPTADQAEMDRLRKAAFAAEVKAARLEGQNEGVMRGRQEAGAFIAARMGSLSGGAHQPAAAGMGHAIGGAGTPAAYPAIMAAPRVVELTDPAAGHTVSGSITPMPAPGGGDELM